MRCTPEESQTMIREIDEGSLAFLKDRINHYDDDVLVAFARNNKRIIDYLPKDRLTDPVLFAVAENELYAATMRFVNPEDTNRYREIAIIAVAADANNLSYVDRAYIDEDFVNQAMARGTSFTLTEFYKQLPELTNQVFDQRRLEDFLISNISARNSFLHDVVTSGLQNSPITDEFIKDSLPVCPGLVMSLLRLGRVNVVTEAISEGIWPSQYAAEKPSDLKDAVKRMMKPMSSTAQAWQKGYAMTFGIEAVVKAMSSSTRMEVLETMYSREDIIPHLKRGKGLKAKGRWIEDDLGL